MLRCNSDRLTGGMGVKKVYVLLWFLSILGLVACGDVNTPSEPFSATDADQLSVPESASDGSPDNSPKQLESNHLDYVKPGADIRFTNDYDGYSEPGVEDVFMLSVRALSPLEGLALSFSASEGMDMLMEAEQTFDMDTNSLEVPVKLYAKNPGTYQLRVYGATNLESGFAQGRSYSLTINVGAQAANTADARQKASSDEAVITTPEGERLIRRSAEEVIY